MKKQWKKMMSWFMTMFAVFFFCGGVYSLQAEAANGEGYLGVKTEARVYDDFQNDIWLQFQQKDMQVGDKATIYPWRMEQVITSAIQNDVGRPNFHFDIIKGDSISLSKTEDTYKVTATAEKAGTTVVKVTYDDLDYGDKHWGAISPVNTAYAVFTVGEEGKATITPSDNLKNWRHYDTIYYCEGETVPYTFTVNTENAVAVKVTVNGQVIQGNGKEYTANLENRSNIIGIEATDNEGKIKSFYRVVDARFIEINVANKTDPTKQNIEAGDTATVSFRGITMPVYKIATIYNPVWSSKPSQWSPEGQDAAYAGYENEQLGSFKGQCGQWDLATKNSFDVTFTESGKYVFKSPKGIWCEWWGSPLGTDITQEGSGTPNTNAPVLKDWFSVMPEFTVVVEDKVPVEKITVDNDKNPGKPYTNATAGDTIKLTANISPDTASNKKVKWSIAYETVKGGVEIIEVSEDTLTATVKTQAIGNYSVLCESAADNMKKGQCNIMVNSVPGEADSWWVAIAKKENPDNLKKKVDNDQITLDLEKQIQDLRATYETFTPEVKDLLEVKNCLDILKQAEEKITTLKLEAAKQEADKMLEAYKAPEKYRPAQQEELKKVIAEAKVKIEAAKTQEELDKILEDAKTAMDKVKTDAQLTEEENSQQKPGSIVPPVQTPDSTPQTPVVNQPQKKAKIAKVKVKAKAGRKTAKLSWKKVKKASGYRIYRATSKNGDYQRVKTLSRKKYSFIDTKVKRNTKYFYKICAYKKVNGKKVNGPFSKIVVVRVK